MGKDGRARRAEATLSVLPRAEATCALCCRGTREGGSKGVSGRDRGMGEGGGARELLCGRREAGGRRWGMRSAAEPGGGRRVARRGRRQAHFKIEKAHPKMPFCVMRRRDSWRDEKA